MKIKNVLLLSLPIITVSLILVFILSNIISNRMYEEMMNQKRLNESLHKVLDDQKKRISEQQASVERLEQRIQQLLEIQLHYDELPQRSDGGKSGGRRAEHADEEGITPALSISVEEVLSSIPFCL